MGARSSGHWTPRTEAGERHCAPATVAARISGEMVLVPRFDHAVVGVRDLDAAIAHWREKLGFEARPGGRHGGGTHNGIVRFGTDYVELISVFDRAAVLASGVADTNALLDLIDRDEGGRPVPQDDARPAGAERSRRLDVLPLLDRERRRAPPARTAPR